jgi:hypothetical protein
MQFCNIKCFYLFKASQKESFKALSKESLSGTVSILQLQASDGAGLVS